MIYSECAVRREVRETEQGGGNMPSKNVISVETSFSLIPQDIVEHKWQTELVLEWGKGAGLLYSMPAGHLLSQPW